MTQSRQPPRKPERSRRDDEDDDDEPRREKRNAEEEEGDEEEAAPVKVATQPSPQPLAVSNPPGRGPKLVLCGTVPPSVQILADLTTLGPQAAVRVQLSANYTIVRQNGYPARPSMTGASNAGLDYPRTIASGTIIKVIAPEAAALVAAGAGTIVP